MFQALLLWWLSECSLFVVGESGACWHKHFLDSPIRVCQIRWTWWQNYATTVRNYSFPLNLPEYCDSCHLRCRHILLYRNRLMLLRNRWYDVREIQNYGGHLRGDTLRCSSIHVHILLRSYPNMVCHFVEAVLLNIYSHTMSTMLVVWIIELCFGI